MIHDIRTVLWKEWAEIAAQPGGWTMSGWRSNLLTVLALGAFLGVSESSWTFWTPSLFATLGGGVLILMQVTDTFAGERERGTLEALLSTPLSEAGVLLGKIASSTLYGWLMGIILLLAAAVAGTVRGEIPMGRILSTGLPAGVVFSLLAVSLVSVVGALISLRSATVKQAQQTLMTVMLLLGLALGGLGGLLVLLVHNADNGPPEWMATLVRFMALGSVRWFFIGSTVLLLLNGVLFSLGLRWFKRETLTLL